MQAVFQHPLAPKQVPLCTTIYLFGGRTFQAKRTARTKSGYCVTNRCGGKSESQRTVQLSRNEQDLDRGGWRKEWEGVRIWIYFESRPGDWMWRMKKGVKKDSMIFGLNHGKMDLLFIAMRKLEERQVWNGRCRVRICHSNSGIPSRYLAQVSNSQLDKNTHLMQ